MARHHYSIIKHYDGKPFDKLDNVRICFRTKHNQILCHQCVCNNLKACEDKDDEFFVVGHMSVLEAGLNACQCCNAWPWYSPWGDE